MAPAGLPVPPVDTPPQKAAKHLRHRGALGPFDPLLERVPLARARFPTGSPDDPGFGFKTPN